MTRIAAYYTDSTASMERAMKSVSISFRVSPLVKQCLEEAAALEQRSQTNMLEKLVLDYCRTHSLACLTEESTCKVVAREEKHGRTVAEG